MTTVTATAAVFIFVFVFSSVFSPSASCHADDKRALLAFKNTLHPASFPSSWSTESDCCLWQYISCSRRNDRVRVVNFRDSPTVSGTIPPSVADLPFLEILQFRDVPNLSGTIPPQVSRLKNLQYLIVDSTRVSGTIPDSIGKLTKLREIILTNNSLTGPIPASLGALSHLFEINLSLNKLTGTIPGSLFSRYSFTFTNLNLDLHGNQLTGDIPVQLGKAPIMLVDLSSNMLTGEHAAVLFGKSKPLSQISLANNRISFNLSTVEWPLKLNSLDISHNQIYGGISEQITTVEDLRLLDVSYNQLCGKIPSGPHFPELGAESFQHNKCLCGKPLFPCK